MCTLFLKTNQKIARFIGATNKLNQDSELIKIINNSKKKEIRNIDQVLYLYIRDLLFTIPSKMENIDIFYFCIIQQK